MTEEKVAVVVVGQECSATCLVTRLLILAGCYGSADVVSCPEYKGWPQKYDVEDPQGETPIVIRRTLPYHPFRKWPDLETLRLRLTRVGYACRFLLILRDHRCIIESQLQHRYVSERSQAVSDHHLCQLIMQGLTLSPYNGEYFHYETLVSDPMGSVTDLCGFAGCDPLDALPEEIFDGNEKYGFQ